MPTRRRGQPSTTRPRYTAGTRVQRRIGATNSNGRARSKTTEVTHRARRGGSAFSGPRRRGALDDGAGTARYLCEVLPAADSLAMTLILLASICEALKVAEFVPADAGRPSLAFTAAVIIDTNGP